MLPDSIVRPLAALLLALLAALSGCGPRPAHPPAPPTPHAAHLRHRATPTRTPTRTATKTPTASPVPPGATKTATAPPGPPASPTATASPTAPNTPSPVPATDTDTPTPSTAPIALGLWIPGDDTTQAVVDSYAALAGAAPRAVMWYADWASGAGFPAAAVGGYAQRGIVSIVSWLPDDRAYPANFDALVAQGSYDPSLHGWARAAATYAKPVYLRFAWEMNTTWQPFAPGAGGNTAADFVAMWRHVHDLFVADGATNVRWVWCPNIEYPGSPSYASLYPGDAYVDWVGLDGYNWGNSQSWSYWTSLEATFAPSYADLTALTAKPVMLGETASTENGGDKGAWIARAFADIPAAFPHIRAVVWFDENKEQDWRVDSSAGALAAWQRVVANPLYGAQLR